ncbi:MAG: hypothetical protein LAO77_14855 [Acidobacteriia bacterium]|nr:hypothetical protein [Terriglobia bacterium]
MNAVVFVLGLTAIAAAQTPSQKIDIVSVTGCLRETTPNTWTLENATDPVPSSANAPPAKDIPATPPVGKNQYRLIGVSEFNLTAHRGHTVIIKGLFIKATPMSRVNMTSVTMVAASCAPAPAR